MDYLNFLLYDPDPLWIHTVSHVRIDPVDQSEKGESDTTVMRFLWVEALLIDMHERL